MLQPIKQNAVTTASVYNQFSAGSRNVADTTRPDVTATVETQMLSGQEGNLLRGTVASQQASQIVATPSNASVSSKTFAATLEGNEAGETESEPSDAESEAVQAATFKQNMARGAGAYQAMIRTAGGGSAAGNQYSQSL